MDARPDVGGRPPRAGNVLATGPSLGAGDQPARREIVHERGDVALDHIPGHVGERLVEEADGVLDAGGSGEQTPQGRADGVEVVDALAVGVDEEYFAIDRLLGDLRVAPKKRAT